MLLCSSHALLQTLAVVLFRPVCRLRSVFAMSYFGGRGRGAGKAAGGRGRDAYAMSSGKGRVVPPPARPQQPAYPPRMRGSVTGRSRSRSRTPNRRVWKTKREGYQDRRGVKEEGSSQEEEEEQQPAAEDAEAKKARKIEDMTPSLLFSPIYILGGDEKAVATASSIVIIVVDITIISIPRV